MKTNYLFPHRFRTVSGALFVLSFIGLFVYTAAQDPESPGWQIPVFALIGNDGFLGDVQFFTMMQNPILDEILVTLVMLSGIAFAFSKEKQEDEMVEAIRLNSLAWATIANYGILVACYLLVYGLPFLNILMGAMFSQLIIFVILFRYKMYRFYNSGHEE